MKKVVRNWVKLYMTWTHSMEQLDFLIMASLYITPCLSHDVMCICHYVTYFCHDLMRYVICSCQHMVWLFSLCCLRLSLCGVLLSLFDVLLSLGDVILLLYINFRKQCWRNTDYVWNSCLTYEAKLEYLSASKRPTDSGITYKEPVPTPCPIG